MEVVGSTVFLVRRESSPAQLIGGIYGYGHSFPEAYTTWSDEVRGSESHQRIVRYGFGGLDCLVRFEADGYLPHLLPLQSEEASKGVRNPSEEDDDDDDQLLSTLGDVALGSHRPSRSSGKKALGIRHGGDHVPQSAIFDLKTRSIKKKETDVLGEQIARLWMMQVPNFILAFHKVGVFEDIEIRDVQKEVRKWEDDNQVILRRFAKLLRKLVSFARDSDDGKLELKREEGSSVLDLRTQTEDVGCVLPIDLEERWVLGEW